MHLYLRSVGFSLYEKEDDINKLLDELQKQNIDKAKVIIYNGDELRCEIRAELASNMGICIIGGIDKAGEFKREFYYPYLYSDDISSTMDCTIQRHIDEEVYSGMIDDNRVGISLIFRLDNANTYMERKEKLLSKRVIETRLSSWSSEGKILLPMMKSAKQKAINKVTSQNRSSLIEAAKNGDEDAMESLTVEDMNLYAQISRRLLHEDIYSIVDSCFMPQGIECDLYSVLGDIVNINKTKNTMTGEEIYDFTLDSNDVLFHVGINTVDLQGEPEIGRRFKGVIWMQGRVNWSD